MRPHNQNVRPKDGRQLERLHFLPRYKLGRPPPLPVISLTFCVIMYSAPPLVGLWMRLSSRRKTFETGICMCAARNLRVDIILRKCTGSNTGETKICSIILHNVKSRQGQERKSGTNIIAVEHCDALHQQFKTANDAGGSRQPPSGSTR